MELSSTLALELLRLQAEWGADEALDEQPHVRMVAPRPALPATNAAPALQTRTPPVLAAGRPLARGQGQQAEAVAAAAQTIEQLRATIRAFDGCSLRDTASHTLTAQGSQDLGVMLIGEVPDADEDRAGIPFAGAAGALLDRMLASINLTRDQIVVAPLIPWRPPGDRKVSPVEMAACLPFLHRLIALAKPARLLLMGTRPTRALLGENANLARLRGRWISVPAPGATAPISVLPMRHPGYLLANPASRREAWHDLLLLRATLNAARQDDAAASQPRGPLQNKQP